MGKETNPKKEGAIGLECRFARPEMPRRLLKLPSFVWRRSFNCVFCPWVCAFFPSLFCFFPFPLPYPSARWLQIGNQCLLDLVVASDQVAVDLSSEHSVLFFDKGFVREITLFSFSW